MEDFWSEDSLQGVPDCVTEVDEIAETGLALVDGDDVRFDGDRADDQVKKEELGLVEVALSSWRGRFRGLLDSGEDLGGP